MQKSPKLLYLDVMSSYDNMSQTYSLEPEKFQMAHLEIVPECSKTSLILLWFTYTHFG